MSDWREYFKNKKVTQMGLGLLGRGVGDAEFLAKYCAEVIVTDLKKPEDLKKSIDRLRQYKNITFVLGGHRMEDFKNRDFILKAAGVFYDSLYIAEAKKNNIPIEMDASLFAKLVKGTTIVGITGTRGKSTTTAIIYEFLRTVGKRVFLAGNIISSATLPLLEKINQDDGWENIIVMELDSWQLQGFDESKISPHISVFTTFLPDHMNYYHNDMERYFYDKSAIYRHQKENDFLVVGDKVAPKIMAGDIKPKSKVKVVSVGDVSKCWQAIIPGEHNKLNIACAIAVSDIFGVPNQGVIRTCLSNFKGLSGRLKPLRFVNGVTIYDDNYSTTPDATIAGLRAIGNQDRKNIILIMGGADKNLDMGGLVNEMLNYCKEVILLPGTGTTKMQNVNLKMENDNLKLKIVEARNLEEAVGRAMSVAKFGDIILFSPAFASFGMFKNEYDRGEQFNEIISDL